MAGFEYLLKGRILCGRYRLEAPIGRGGMGAVFRAFDEQLERPVAIKVVVFPDAGEEMHEQLRARFRREAKLAARLRHPNVVRTYDFGTDDALSLDFLVMELLSGTDLRQLLQRHGPPPAAVALRLVREAAAGVAAGHRATPGLIHRDIKPANLFLADPDDDGEARVVVLDFGIALPDGDDRTLTRLTQAAVGPHSRVYAAPEQLAGRPLTPACDVFSLAATAYELFTGRAPAGGDGDLSVTGAARALEAAQHHLASDAAAFPPGVAEVLARALRPDPAERHPDAAAFGQALQAAAAPPPPFAVPVAPAAPTVTAPVVAGPVGRSPAPPRPADPPRPAPPAPAGPEAPRSTAAPVLAVLGVIGLAVAGIVLALVAAARDSSLPAEVDPAAADTAVAVTAWDTMPADTVAAPAAPDLSLISPAALASVGEQGRRPGPLLLDQTFSVSQTIDQTDGGQYLVYHDGRAYLSTQQEGYAALHAFPLPHADVLARVSLRYEEGPPDGGAGFHLRDGIFVSIDASSGGAPPAYAVFVFRTDRWEEMVPWTVSSLIRADEENTLEVVVIGDTLTIFMNGALLRAVTGVPRPTGPIVNLRVGDRETMYSFDDLVVLALDA